MCALIAMAGDHESALGDQGGIGMCGVQVDGRLAEWLLTLAHECGFDRQVLHIRRHRRVYRPGDHDRALYLVRFGLVATMVPGRANRKCIISLSGPGDVFGELALASHAPQNETALVMRDASLVRIPAAAVMARMGEAKTCALLLAHFAQLVAHADLKLAMLLKCSAEQRLAVTLIRLAAHGYQVCDEQIIQSGPTLAATPPLTQQELAELIGTTRTRVCTFLCQFRERGLISVGEEDCYVVDAVALRDYLVASFSPTRAARGRTTRPGHAAAC